MDSTLKKLVVRFLKAHDALEAYHVQDLRSPAGFPMDDSEASQRSLKSSLLLNEEYEALEALRKAVLPPRKTLAKGDRVRASSEASRFLREGAIKYGSVVESIEKGVAKLYPHVSYVDGGVPVEWLERM